MAFVDAAIYRLANELADFGWAGDRQALMAMATSLRREGFGGVSDLESVDVAQLEGAMCLFYHHTILRCAACQALTQWTSVRGCFFVE